MSFVTDTTQKNMRTFHNKTLPRYSNLYFEEQASVRSGFFTACMLIGLFGPYGFAVGLFTDETFVPITREVLTVAAIVVMCILIGFCFQTILWGIQKEQGYRFLKDGIHIINRKAKDTGKVYSYELVQKAVKEHRYAYKRREFVLDCSKFKLKFPYGVGDEYEAKHSNTCLEALCDRGGVELPHPLSSKVIGYLDRKYYFRKAIRNGIWTQLIGISWIILILMRSFRIEKKQLILGAILAIVSYIGLYITTMNGKRLSMTHKKMELECKEEAAFTKSDRFGYVVALAITILLWAALSWFIFYKFG